jgi:hypothetical protein
VYLLWYKFVYNLIGDNNFPISFLYFSYGNAHINLTWSNCSQIFNFFHIISSYVYPMHARLWMLQAMNPPLHMPPFWFFSFQNPHILINRVFWLLIFQNITLNSVVAVLIWIYVLIFLESQREISNLGVSLCLRVTQTIATVALANNGILLQ